MLTYGADTKVMVGFGLLGAKLAASSSLHVF